MPQQAMQGIWLFLPSRQRCYIFQSVNALVHESSFTHVPALFAGMDNAGMPTASVAACPEITSCVISLSYTPGAIALTRTLIPLRANSVENILVR
jgi:hypothetical protein